MIKENLKDPVFAREWENGEKEYQLRYMVLDRIINGRKQSECDRTDLEHN
ncbi:hypothetical protein [Thermoactinomyces sp. DSM 45891]|nr:hypothetical protein [Thermoactinomyces sp. DSM 45891]